MKHANYFCDGYTQPGFIRAISLLHAELRFTYRPASIEERSQLVEAGESVKSDAYDRHVAAFLAGKLITWELVDERGNEVPISATDLLRLPPDLFVKLQQIVVGRVASDADPQWDAPTSQRLVDEQRDATTLGRSIGEAREEQEVKN